MSKKQCYHCGPLPTNHLVSWINCLLESSGTALEIKIRKILGKRIWRFFSGLEQKVSRILIFLLEKLKIISFAEKIEREKIYNRTLVFIDEGLKRNIEVKPVLFWGKYNNHFAVWVKNKRIIFEGLPRGRSNKPETLLIDDKAGVKKILKNHGLPTADGAHFWRKQKAIEYGKKLGFPLVVKPRYGSISRHVFFNIADGEELKRAIDNVKKISPCFVLEKYLVGADVYRATLINFKIGGVAKRIPANVVGDGCHTIKELIEIKNSDPARGEPKQKNCTFLKIVIDETTDKLLKSRGLTLDSVPSKGETIFLQEKIILDLGSDLIDVTDVTHQDNLLLFEETAKIFDARLVGIDFLCADIGVSWKDQECGIIELNSLPFIDMHHFPLRGQPRNLARMVWEMIENEYQLS